MNSTVHKKIYKAALDALSVKPLATSALIESIMANLYRGIVSDEGRIGEFTEIRGLVGAVISEMKDNGVIAIENGECVAVSSSPLTLRLESCEQEIITFLKQVDKTKQQIRAHLQRRYRTDETKSNADDKLLFEYMGRILRLMITENKISLTEGKYTLSQQTAANLDDISDLLELKSTFISKIHRNGGEFFEHYIMTLLEKYSLKCRKTVVECRIIGGASDGGIDGIIKTVDPLGFKETIMVQAKNRTDLTNETVVRGFYGAVCAFGGSRGIFATTSDFHPSAKLFLSSIDNCVGLNGEDIFNIACECLYGIKKKGKKLLIDNKIL